MKIHKLLAGSAAVFAFTTLFSPAAQAGPEEEIIQLTHRMEDDIAHLKDDFQAHYRWTWQYAGLLNLLAQAESTNNVVHGLSHDSLAGATVLKRNISKLDNQIHQLHDAVDDVEKGTSAQKVQGNTAAVHSHLDDMNQILHRMEDIAEARVNYYNSHNNHAHHEHGHNQPAQNLQVIRTPFGYIQLNQGQQQVTTSNQWNNTPRQQTQPRNYPQAQQQPRGYPQSQLPNNNSSNSIFDRLRSKIRNR